MILVGLAEVVPQAQAVLENGWLLILIVIDLAILTGQIAWGRSGTRTDV